jgi:hypothetical protein
MNNNQLQRLIEILSILGTIYSVLKLKDTDSKILKTLDEILCKFQDLYNELSDKNQEKNN